MSDLDALIEQGWTREKPKYKPYSQTTTAEGTVYLYLGTRPRVGRSRPGRKIQQMQLMRTWKVLA